MNEKENKSIGLTFLPTEFDRLYANIETLEGFESVRDTILVAFNNCEEHPDDAIQNLLSAILEINYQETRKELRG